MQRTFRRPLVSLLACILIAYAALCALLYAAQRSLIYTPQATRVPAASTDFALVRERTTLRGWVVNPGRPDALLYFGGNAERIEAERERFAAWFPGRTAYLLAYRGYGASEGEPSEAALCADAVALYDRVRQVSPGARIAAIGRSLGSGVATCLAAERPLDRLALVTPFDSLAATAQSHYPWLPATLLIKDRYDSVRNLARYQGPLLIVRAGRDEVIPARNTLRLIAAARRLAPTVVTLPGAGHNTIDDFAAYGEALTRFVSAP